MKDLGHVYDPFPAHRPSSPAPKTCGWDDGRAPSLWLTLAWDIYIPGPTCKIDLAPSISPKPYDGSLAALTKLMVAADRGRGYWLDIAGKTGIAADQSV